MLHRIIALSVLLTCISAISSAIGQTRIALVIGNSNYSPARPLRNPVNDADTMELVLKELHFDVRTVRNGVKKQMEWEMDRFAKDIQKPNTVSLFYFAGHGIQVNETNYLIPVDANIKSTGDIINQTISVSDFLKKLENVGNNEVEGRVNLILIDACRDNNIGRAFNIEQVGLAPIEAPAGTLISFSTSSGDPASDGENRNSPYVEGLKDAMRKAGHTVEQTFKATRKYVMKATASSGHPQKPWESTSLTGDFYFVPPKQQVVAENKIESKNSIPAEIDSNTASIRKDPTILYQFYNISDDIAKEISKKLSILGWNVPEDERTDNARNYNEIRYHPGDAAAAKLLAEDFKGVMRELNINIEIRLVNMQSIRPGFPELWISIR